MDSKQELKNELTTIKELVSELTKSKELLEERTLRSESDLVREQQEVAKMKN